MLLFIIIDDIFSLRKSTVCLCACLVRASWKRCVLDLRFLPSLWVIRPVGVPTCQAGSSLAPGTPPHWRHLFSTIRAPLSLQSGSLLRVRCSSTSHWPFLTNSHTSRSQWLEVTFRPARTEEQGKRQMWQRKLFLRDAPLIICLQMTAASLRAEMSFV